MKITIEDRPDGGEDEIIIRCKHVDEHLLKLVYALKAGQEKLTVTKGTDIVQVMPKEIFYFEAVDNKVFLYLEKDVYETKQTLYELEERLDPETFMRSHRSYLVNPKKVLRATP